LGSSRRGAFVLVGSFEYAQPDQKPLRIGISKAKGPSVLDSAGRVLKGMA